jgi:hypothetical protein
MVGDNPLNISYMTEESTIKEKRDAAGFENAEGVKEVPNGVLGVFNLVPRENG